MRRDVAFEYFRLQYMQSRCALSSRRDFRRFPTMAAATTSYDQKISVMAALAEAHATLKVAQKQVEDIEVMRWQILEMDLVFEFL